MWTLLAFALAFSLFLVVVGHLASAGSADAPEISDPPGDCAVPYGNLYLDATSAWIDNEDDDSFDVHLALAGWEDEVAEGAGYAVQFVHQGLQWGVIAFYSPAVEDGWVFWTGQATLDDVSDTVDAPGSFDAGTSTIHVTFEKGLFPHVNADDTTLRGLAVMTVDVRPAYPFIVASDAVEGANPDGRWALCDEATSDATFAFQHGGHSAAHATAPANAPANATASGPVAAASVEEPGEPVPLSPQPNEKRTPLGPLAALGALALAARRRGS